MKIFVTNCLVTSFNTDKCQRDWRKWALRRDFSGGGALRRLSFKSGIQFTVIRKSYYFFRFSAVSFTPAVVYEGGWVTLTCSITPHTSVKTTKWELNGSPITSKLTYTINKVSQKDAGTWSCLIANKQTQANISTSVEVRGADFFFIFITHIYRNCNN